MTPELARAAAPEGEAEGTETGTPNVFAPAFGRPVPLDKAAALHDIMGEDGTFAHYPIGWTNASNTPYRLYKQYAALGGVADPLIVSWPGKIADKGAVRRAIAAVSSTEALVCSNAAACDCAPAASFSLAALIAPAVTPSSPTLCRNDALTRSSGAAICRRTSTSTTPGTDVAA